MSIFKLTGFKKDHHLTLRLKAKSRASQSLGDIAVSYLIVPLVNDRSRRSSRLLVKLTAKYPQGFYWKMMRVLLPWGDLIMMRRQLLNLKRLAEETEKGKAS